MKRKIIYFTAPKRVEFREESMPAPGADEVLVETSCSSISAGTEMLVYRGQFPQLDNAHDLISSGLKYPTPFGYACVGKIVETGSAVNKDWRDRLVFGFHSHATHFIARIDSLLPAPASLDVEACSFLPNMETAVNLIQDAAPILGERVLVLGQGVVGLMVASLLKEFPLEVLVSSDCYEMRRKASRAIGTNDSFDPALLNEKNMGMIDKEHQSAYAQAFDLTFELSGSPLALDDAIAMTAFNGRILIGSWYGEKRASINLGGAFHRSRIKLISSQVSTIAPELTGRWDKARRFNVAWEALRRIQPQKWITHRFPIEDAKMAYELLDKNPQETIQVLFQYGRS
jgi:2-desacetyl-2-hydroxyethyl bacteriochlorophyllide A dehydrogenase